MERKPTYPKGSEWGKWDLQIQPIKSEWLPNVQERLDDIKSATLQFLTQATERGVCAVAITDHNCGAAIDAALELVRDKNLSITVLPGVEIDDPAGFQLLMIFNPDYRQTIGKATWREAVEHFLNNVCRLPSPVFTTDSVAEPIKCELHELLSRVCVEDIAVPIFAHAQGDKGLFKKTTATNRLKLFQGQAEAKFRFAIDHKTDAQIAQTISTLVGWGIKAKDFAFIKTSDAHQASEAGSNFTWIKAERTYEGLKQIVYDPTSRTANQTVEPPRPTNTIESITFRIPAGASITIPQANAKEKQEAFCFAGLEQTYQLSPYLNCLVGGRGVGKSTLLNFLGQHSVDARSARQFWSRIRPSFDTSDLDLFALDGVTTFEFIGQSEVEGFATNKESFTAAIYQRADVLSEGSLLAHGTKLGDLLERLHSFQSLIDEIEELSSQRLLKERERMLLARSIEVTMSDEYAGIVATITGMSNEKQHLERWRHQIENLKARILEARHVYLKDQTATVGTESSTLPAQVAKADIAQPYRDAYAKALEHVSEAERILDPDNFHTLTEIENGLVAQISEQEDALTKLLKGAGLSDENILQAKSAPQKLVRLDDELAELKERIRRAQEEFSCYATVLVAVQTARADHEDAIKSALKPLISTLEEQAQENQRKDIRSIGLNYFFDSEAAWRSIANDVYSLFASRYGAGERPDALKTYVINHKDQFSGQQSQIVELLEREERTAGYIKFLRDVFSSNYGYEIFLTIRDRHLNDVHTYKRIQVMYDGKDIERASFGQKCTAVMVILLLFGNFPLIVDEPEAHLDSSLIANYLVPLIRKKKSNRQIIFSTHNANFVINGDAEKIFVLTNDTGTSRITEATIEDLDNRDELLKLEGGREAFRKRGEKLRI